MNNYDYVAIVNAVNGKHGGMYDYKWPVVTDETFNAMSAAFQTAPDRIKNTYFDELWNVLFKTEVLGVYKATNPFRFLYGPETDFQGEAGQYKQIVAVDQIYPEPYDPNASAESFFSQAPLKVKVQTICNCLRKKYPITMNDLLAEQAFESLSKFDTFWVKAQTRLYNDMEEDDKEEIMAMQDAGIRGGNVYLYPLARPVDSQTALKFSYHLGIFMNDVGFKRRRQWNLAHLSTKTAEEDMVFQVENSVLKTQNLYNLAWAINSNYLKLLERGQMIEVDSDGMVDNKVYAMVYDKGFFNIQMVNGFPILKQWENGERLEHKYWLHNQKCLNTIYMYNAIAFCDPKDVGIGSVTVKPKDTKVRVGKFLEMDVPDVKPTTPGMLFDAFLNYTAAGDSQDPTANHGFTDSTTYIDKWSGVLHIGKNETAKKATITGTSHLDPNKAGTVEITINH